MHIYSYLYFKHTLSDLEILKKALSKKHFYSRTVKSETSWSASEVSDIEVGAETTEGLWHRPYLRECAV